MEPASIRAVVETRVGPELADLGRPAVLAALCDGDPTTSVILRAALSSERSAAATFATWAETAATDAERSTYERVTSQERRHARQVAAMLSEPPDVPVAPGPLHGYLRGLQAPAARAGAGLVGRPLASLRTYGRIRQFARSVDDLDLDACIGELVADTRGTVETGETLLASLDDAGQMAERAIEAATYTVRLIHDDYADALAAIDRTFS